MAPPGKEFEESWVGQTNKTKKLADMIRHSRRTVVYTGAGISTAAEIPDYRGPNGIWTLATQGKEVTRCANMTEAEPTLSHMILRELYRRGNISHILSQNCDGLHLRSGLPQECLSEIHGNMFVEVCSQCEPVRQFIRPYDVTEKSAFKRHETGRRCDDCNSPLVDTIVHFGEVGKIAWPLNWLGTTSIIQEADLIICIGTSLNVLKSYRFLWPTSGSKTKLVIINLQNTPKDNVATMKIAGRSDNVLMKLAEILKINPGVYCRECDPVLNPKRTARQAEIMNKITECTCRARPPRTNLRPTDFPTVTSRLETGPPAKQQPGWWAAGIERIKRKNSKAVAEPEPEHLEDGRRKSARIASVAPPPKKCGRPRKRHISEESELEKDVRLSLLATLNDIEPLIKKRRGRPQRGLYVSPFEKEGSFKFEYDSGVVESAVKDDASSQQPSTSKHQHYDSEDDAEEMMSSSDDEEMVDPSFRVPKQQMLRLASRPGNISPRRRSSAELRRESSSASMEVSPVQLDILNDIIEKEDIKEEEAEVEEEPNCSKVETRCEAIAAPSKVEEDSPAAVKFEVEIKEEIAEEETEEEIAAHRYTSRVPTQEIDFDPETMNFLEDDDPDPTLNPLSQPERRAEETSTSALALNTSNGTSNGISHDCSSNGFGANDYRPNGSSHHAPSSSNGHQVVVAPSLLPQRVFYVPGPSMPAPIYLANGSHGAQNGCSSSNSRDTQMELAATNYPGRQIIVYTSNYTPNVENLPRTVENPRFASPTGSTKSSSSLPNMRNYGSTSMSPTSPMSFTSDDELSVRKVRRSKLMKFLESNGESNGNGKRNNSNGNAEYDTLMSRANEYFPSSKRQAPLSCVLKRNIDEIKQDFDEQHSDAAVIEMMVPEDNDSEVCLPADLQNELELLIKAEGGSKCAITLFLQEHVMHPGLMDITIKDLMDFVNKCKRRLGMDTQRGRKRRAESADLWKERDERGDAIQ